MAISSMCLTDAFPRLGYCTSAISFVSCDSNRAVWLRVSSRSELFDRKPSMAARSALLMGFTSLSRSTNRRYPLSVGTRPLEV